MRIAVFHNLPSGGALRAASGLLTHLIRAGHIVDVFIPSTAEENFLSLGKLARRTIILPVHKTGLGVLTSIIKYIPPLPGFNVSLADLEKTQKLLAAQITMEQYDVAYVEQDQYTMSAFILKYLRVPHVYYCHQPSRLGERVLIRLQEAGRRSAWKRFRRAYAGTRLVQIDRQNASHAGLILANSYFSRETILRAYGLDARVSYLGVDTDLFRPIKLTRGSYVLSVGALSPLKGFEFILDALSLVRKRRRPRLVIVSNSNNPPMQRSLERLAAHGGVSLEIKTFVHDAELVRLYNQARAVVYAPYLEPFGLVPLEAMACGTPVVAVKEGGIRETVLHNETGVLTARDPAEFAGAVEALLSNDGKRHAMGARARQVIRNSWTLEHGGERLLRNLELAKNTQR